MKHSIKLSVEFYFKGELFSPAVNVDLDHFLMTNRDVESWYEDLGRSIGFDRYRHEYDVMVCETICFSEPVGLVTEHIEAGQVDWQSLRQAWQNQKDRRAITPIANKYFNVENIEAHPKLAAALMDAYRAGAASSPKKNHGLNEGFYG